jgi:hypothetical protein
MSFKTAPANTGIVVNKIERILHGDVSVWGDYGSGYHFRFFATANNLSETWASLKIADWSNTVSTIAIAGNTKMALSKNWYDDYASATWATVELTNNYGTLQNISSIDADENTWGRQFVIDIFYKIPNWASWAYSTSYGMKTE